MPISNESKKAIKAKIKVLRKERHKFEIERPTLQDKYGNASKQLSNNMQATDELTLKIDALEGDV